MNIYVRLSTINRWLRFFGLVLVVEYESESKEPTRLWIERYSKYEERCKSA